MEEIKVDLSVNALAHTPQPSQHWVLLSAEERLGLVNKELISLRWKYVEVLHAGSNGYITIALLEPLAPAERGHLLLDLEDRLKKKIDPGLTVWLEPQADKSVLRKLRGVEVK
tara:strand:+ start:231 stop:569 length:339 start_codon:yes stop_codon:yes gene_type:complete